MPSDRKIIANYLDSRNQVNDACRRFLNGVLAFTTTRKLAKELKFSPAYICLVSTGKVTPSDGFLKSLRSFGDKQCLAR